MMPSMAAAVASVDPWMPAGGSAGPDALPVVPQKMIDAETTAKWSVAPWPASSAAPSESTPGQRATTVAVLVGELASPPRQPLAAKLPPQSYAGVAVSVKDPWEAPVEGAPTRDPW